MGDKDPYLEALTPQARAALGGPELKIFTLPFHIGLESRYRVIGNRLIIKERRKKLATPNNDLYLLDQSMPRNVSRKHLQIEQVAKQQYRCVDRGSTCGTIVGNQHLGSHEQSNACLLKDGDVIVVGTSESPFVFRFFLKSV